MDTRASHLDIPLEPPSLDLLVADANAADGQRCASALEAAGHRVRLAVDGVELLRSVLRQAPDLVVLDLLMPKIDALQAARLLRAVEPPGCRMPIIGTYAADETCDREPLQAAGIDLFLPKPLDVDALPGLVIERWSSSARANPARGTGRSRADVDGPPSVNLAASIERLGGDRALLSDLIGFFFEDAFPLLASIHASLLRRDWEAARRSAHSLKGLAANFGASAAVAALQTIEAMPDAPAHDVLTLERKVDREIAKLAAALADFAEANPRES